MTGSKRLQSALLVQPVEYSTLNIVERAHFIERIWSLVQEANKQCPAHAAVLKTHIIIVLPERPFKRAGKGTVQRAFTLEMYSQELDALYKDADRLISPSSESRLRHSDEDNLTRCIIQETTKLTESNGVLRDDNLFVRGMDSLQVLALTRELRHLFCGDIAPSTIYANFNTRLLSKAIQKLLSQEQVMQDQDVTAAEQAIATVFETHKNDIDPIVNSSTSDDTEVVLLIGSMGTLGANLLSVLLARCSISYTYCLSRAPELGNLQAARSEVLGLNTSFPVGRFLKSTATSFISPSDFATIAGTVTLVIYVAWPVNFNLALATFCPSLDSVSSLASLTISSPRTPNIIFISSIASVFNHFPSLVPEVMVTIPSAPDHTEHDQSKYIAEKVLGYAAQQYNIRATIIRLGQITGPACKNTNGKWNVREWLPSLVLSSRFLRKLLASLGGSGVEALQDTSIDWMPIDELSEALVESAMWIRKNDTDEASSGNEHRPRVLNMCNPHRTSWLSMLPLVKAAFEVEGDTVSMVAYDEWLQALKMSASTMFESGASREDVAKRNLALRLIEFSEKIAGKDIGVAVEMEKALSICPRLEGISRIDGEMMRRWVEAWINTH